jgi:hypothetical protein
MFPGISPLPAGAFVDAGSITYDTPGEYDWVCPNHNNVNVKVKGGGAGGMSYSYTNTVSGTFVFPNSSFDALLGEASSFNSTLVGAGGVYGSLGNSVQPSGSRTPGTAGPDAIGSGGDTNTTGGGAAGGNGGDDDVGHLGGKGGNGGYAEKDFAAGTLIPGQTYKVIVGAKGTGLTVIINTAGFAHPQGYDGVDGSVEITWT